MSNPRSNQKDTVKELNGEIVDFVYGQPFVRPKLIFDLLIIVMLQLKVKQIKIPIVDFYTLNIPHNWNHSKK